MVLSSRMRIILMVQFLYIIIGPLSFPAQTHIINPSYWSFPYTVRFDLLEGPLYIKIRRGEKGGQNDKTKVKGVWQGGCYYCVVNLNKGM
jgi:hypothetical protein